MDKLDIKAIKSRTEGTVQGSCLVTKSEIVSRTKNNFLALTLSDGEHEITAKQWSFVGVKPQVGNVIDIDADINIYNNTVNLIIKDWEWSDVDVSAFEKSAPLNVEDILKEMQGYIDSISDEDLKLFINAITEDYIGLMYTVPGATGMHHNYKGGWAMHTLEVMRCALVLAQLRNDINPKLLNMDLIIAGAYLHDIGKLEAYTLNEGIPEMTYQGKFLDHICLGLMLLERYRIEVFGTKIVEWYTPLCHIVASHHGKLEWGSPVVPCIPEALEIHKADLESADMEMFHRELEEMSSDWQTNKSFKFGTRLYSGIYNKR